MILPLSIAGLILSIILLYFNARRYRSAIYLGVFFFLVSLYNFVQYILLYSKSVTPVAVVFLHFGPVAFLIGPALYVYVRGLLTDDPRLKKTDLWHLLPALINFIGLIPYLLTDWHVKREIAERIVEKAENIGSPIDVLFTGYLTHEAIYLSRPILILVYILWCTGMIIQYRKERKTFVALSHQNYMIKWLLILFGFLFIFVISHLAILINTFIADQASIFYTFNTLKTISAVGLSGLLISPFFFPYILYGLPKVPLPFREQNPFVPEAILQDPAKEKNSHRKLESEYLQLIKDKMDEAMKELKPYLNPDCNQEFISRLISIPAHHIAYYCRSEIKESFNDYRNRWRVRYAKELILNGKTKSMTLEAIGLSSGFSTRQTFITAFKKYEGILPSVFASNNNSVNHAR